MSKSGGTVPEAQAPSSSFHMLRQVMAQEPEGRGHGIVKIVQTSLRSVKEIAALQRASIMVGEGNPLQLIETVQIFFSGNAQGTKVALDFKDREIFLRSDDDRPDQV